MRKIKMVSIVLISIIILFLIQQLFFSVRNNIVHNSISYVVSPTGRFFSKAGWWLNDKIFQKIR